MQTIFNTLLILFAVAITAPNAYASKLDSLADSVHCYEQADETWTQEEVLGYSARILPKPVIFFGKTDITAVFPNTQQTIIAAAMHLDKGDEERSKGHAVWKWMAKHYGDPLVTNSSWVWRINDTKINAVEIAVLSTGTVVVVECR